MFQRVTRPFSKSKICRPVVKALSSAAMLASLGASVLTNQTFACEHCAQSCPSCSCSQGYAPRSKPLSVLQLGHLVDGLDHAADRLERTLAPRHHGFGCDAIGCDHCDGMVGQHYGQTTFDSTVWNNYVPEVTGSAPGHNSVLVPNARPKLIDPPIGTGVQEKIEYSAPTLPVPQPFNPSAVPSLQVPTSAPQEDYRHDPFGDDAGTTAKPRNRYTENSKSKSIQVPQSRASETAKAAPAPYTREHGLAHLAAQQQKPAARATAQSNVPVKSKAEAQTNVELATANKPSQGIRVQIGNKFVAPRPVTSTPIQAVYEATVNSDDLVQPATALRLSN